MPLHPSFQKNKLKCVFNNLKIDFLLHENIYHFQMTPCSAAVALSNCSHERVTAANDDDRCIGQNLMCGDVLHFRLLAEVMSNPSRGQGARIDFFASETQHELYQRVVYAESYCAITECVPFGKLQRLERRADNQTVVKQSEAA